MTTDSFFTPGAERSLQLARRLAARAAADWTEPAHLLWALVLDESQGAEILAAHGLSLDTLSRQIPLKIDELEVVAGETAVPPAELGEALQLVLVEARRQAAALGKFAEIGSEHLLCGLAATPSEVQELLIARGLHPEIAAEKSIECAGDSTAPLEAEIRLSFPETVAAEAVDTLRTIDAAANRAREGLRVVEDFARFTLNDRFLTTQLKNWRHRLAEVLAVFDSQQLVAARDTQADVGTSVSTRREGIRTSPRDVVTANFKRVQEATRTLEEFSKILSPELGSRLEGLRYELYTLEKALLTAQASGDQFTGRNLYLLVSSETCPHGSGPVIHAALAAGAGIIQVREKRMRDRELMTYGRLVREWTARAGALFIMNDRPDLALLTDADGVHVGQEELTVREARRIVGPSRLVGVSTHSIEQARQAVLDGADYIGVGPVFPSTTKKFAEFPGLNFVRQVAEEISLPAYPIGGIGLENIDQVLAQGARRVAVSGAVCGAVDPAEAVRGLQEKLCARSANPSAESS
ncbi:MAG: thiamine phosphate synthase [Planctomycetes bacterium]|nr:thiamine phosphate synthase [Planctomycetota bacterium]